MRIQNSCHVRNFPTYAYCISSSLGVKEDLEYAKHVLNSEYTVVGKLENLDETMDLLEAKVPHFFKGIKSIYYKKRKSKNCHFLA